VIIVMTIGKLGLSLPPFPFPFFFVCVFVFPFIFAVSGVGKYHCPVQQTALSCRSEIESNGRRG
jgi:hypothetical protein